MEESQMGIDARKDAALLKRENDLEDDAINIGNQYDLADKETEAAAKVALTKHNWDIDAAKKIARSKLSSSELKEFTRMQDDIFESQIEQSNLLKEDKLTANDAANGIVPGTEQKPASERNKAAFDQQGIVIQQKIERLRQRFPELSGALASQNAERKEGLLAQSNTHTKSTNDYSSYSDDDVVKMFAESDAEGKAKIVGSLLPERRTRIGASLKSTKTTKGKEADLTNTTVTDETPVLGRDDFTLLKTIGTFVNGIVEKDTNRVADIYLEKIMEYPQEERHKILEIFKQQKRSNPKALALVAEKL
jgi:hypothetical protein